ncbi:MAG TPA: helix-turn-helix transcriptional regulator [Fibrobacteria bacterium]|nr:helix-turn-helix transcriptional regulator [Fibrobacteria bacterium]
MDFLKHLGENIRSRIRKKSAGSIELFAHENQIPKSTLSEILNGKNDPRLTTLAKICSGLEIPLSELFIDPALESWVRESAAKYNPRSPRPSSPRRPSTRKPSKEKGDSSKKK